MISVIQADIMRQVLTTLFSQYGYSAENAKVLANTHTESSLYGVNSHGINRVPLFIQYLQEGIIKKEAKVKLAQAFGQIERWDGQFGSGVINAIKCTARAIELAKSNGMGLVALRNTNHWMRAGTYGWQAANNGCIGIMFTNTQPNMPAWGGKNSRIGNNPLVISIPRKQGHIVLDMALSQFSFGKIQEYQLKGRKLPYLGGWDDQDQLSDDPEKILATERGLPIGYWKGSAFSMVLDMLATLLSAGNSTSKISTQKVETGISQVFLCIDPNTFGDSQLQEKLLEEIINYTRDVEPIDPKGKVYYPGERALQNYQHNSSHGIQVNTEVWQQVLQLLETKPS